jgi:hypothetical protein
MKEKSIYKIGERLGITTAEIKIIMKRNRNKIIAGMFFILALLFLGNNAYQPLHRPASINDFDFFMRFF